MTPDLKKLAEFRSEPGYWPADEDEAEPAVREDVVDLCEE